MARPPHLYEKVISSRTGSTQPSLEIQGNGLTINEGDLDLGGEATLSSYKIVTEEHATDYTVLIGETGMTYIATAAVNFTLPAVATAAGCHWRFYQTADENLVVTAPANTLVAPNDATATSVTFGTTGEQIGACVEVFCDGTLYYAIIQAVEAVTVTVA